MLIHVRGGKWGRDRFVMLSERLLYMLRMYWKLERPPGLYLFCGLTQRGRISPAYYVALSAGHSLTSTNFRRPLHLQKNRLQNPGSAHQN